VTVTCNIFRQKHHDDKIHHHISLAVCFKHKKDPPFYNAEIPSLGKIVPDAYNTVLEMKSKKWLCQDK